VARAQRHAEGAEPHQQPSARKHEASVPLRKRHRHRCEQEASHAERKRRQACAEWRKPHAELKPDGEDQEKPL
jgi:hypothetical protein